MNAAEARDANEGIATVVVNAINFAGYKTVHLGPKNDEWRPEAMGLVEFAHWLADACAAVDREIGLVVEP
jgi:hypothetical protein